MATDTSRVDSMRNRSRPTPADPLIHDHPLSKLPSRARSIVEAATRVVMREGLKGLTLRAVAAEADVYADSIRYYFGGKKGLVRAVSLSVSHDLSVALVESVRTIEDERERTKAVADVGRRIAEDTAGYRVYWELLPEILADAQWTAREAEDYEWCRALYAHYAPPAPVEFEALPDPGRARSLTTLMVAVVDGLALQNAIDPSRVDLPAAFALWAEVLDPLIGETLVPHAGS